MKLKPKFSIAEHFETVEEPRIERSKEHLLIDILTIAILAVICGAALKDFLKDTPADKLRVMVG